MSAELTLPHRSTSVALIDDSLTDEGDWATYFNVKSVIKFSMTQGVLNRLSQVVEDNPNEIFLMIGTNDLYYNQPITDIIANF